MRMNFFVAFLACFSLPMMSSAMEEILSVTGPGREAPVIEDSDKMPVWDLEMEHRADVEGAVELPDKRGISQSVYEELGVDLFFSLWFVFLNNKVSVSDEPFTILAPVNSSKTTPEALLQDEALAEEVIANHFLLGEEIKLAELKKDQKRRTAGGQQLVFKVDKNGEIWVNSVRILGLTKVKNGVIFAIEDYLYADALAEHLDSNKKKKKKKKEKENEISNDVEDGKRTTASLFKLFTTTAKTTTTTETTTTRLFQFTKKPKTTTTTPLFLFKKPTTSSPSTTKAVTSTEPSTTTTAKGTPRKDWVMREKCRVASDNQGTIFKNIVVCVEEWVDPLTLVAYEGTAAPKQKEVRRDDGADDIRIGGGSANSNKNNNAELRAELRQAEEEEPLLAGIIQDIVDELSLFRNPGSNHFLRYITTEDIGKEFREDTKYTALIPMDDAFQRWHPIDWGFNPFNVKPFLRRTLLDHFVVGEVDPSKVSEGDEFQTVGGRNVTFTSGDGGPGRMKIRANGVNLIEGGTTVPHGTLLFIERLMFVDREVVSKLNKEYSYLESGPLLPSPWYRSQFLSHAYDLLSDREEFTYMTEYMNMTGALGQYAEGLPVEVPSPGKPGYTLFAPRDDAFWRLFVQDATAPDPFILDDDFRLQTLLNHVVVGRFFSFDLEDGDEINTVGGKTLTVRKDPTRFEGVAFDDGRQTVRVVGGGKESYVYNLGNVYFVDKVLFTETSDVLRVMEADNDRVREELDEDDEEDGADELSVGELVGVEDFGTKAKEESPRATRKDVELERLEGPPASLEFPLIEDLDKYEERVIYYNNQRISILRQKTSEGEEGANPDY